jgi:hypothetical protein
MSLMCVLYTRFVLLVYSVYNDASEASFVQVTFWIGHTTVHSPADGMGTKHVDEGFHHKANNNGRRRSSVQPITELCGMEPAQIHTSHDHSKLFRDSVQANVHLLEESAEKSDLCSLQRQVPKQVAESAI